MTPRARIDAGGPDAASRIPCQPDPWVVQGVHGGHDVEDAVRLRRLRWTSRPRRQAHRDGGAPVKYVILIHSNPQPWGHPTTSSPRRAGRSQPGVARAGRQAFDALLEEIDASGEFVTAEALADPASSTLYGWSPEGQLRTDGPYAETKEQLAGFFLIDCETRSGPRRSPPSSPQPGGTVELRPAMWGDGRLTTSESLRGRVAGGLAARPRGARAQVRRLRRVRGRRPGGAAGRGPPVAGRGRAGQPAAGG